MFRRSALAAVGGLAAAAGLVGCGGTDGPSLRVEQVAVAGGTFQNPRDAVPGKGGAIFFTADGAGGPGVFVAASDEAQPRALATGRPLESPVGITLSADQETVFVADASADAVFTLPVGGGRPAVLPGSAGLAPHGVEVKGDQLYVTGIDPQSEKPALLVMPASGGAARVLASDGLVLPDGIAVADDGTVFVSDGFSGTVHRVADGRATPLKGVSGAVLGNPAGIAIGPDGTSLLISSLHPKAGTAQVLVLDIASGRLSTFDDVIGANHGAGGLHKASDAAVYGWADIQRPGRVYRIEP